MPELILALDVTEKKKALEIAHACAPYLDAIKIGYPLALSAGLSIAGELKKEGLPLIADFKVADIPNTNTLICDQVFNAGFSGVICHGFCGMDSVKACVASARAHKGECFVVAEMSHPGGKEFFSRRAPGADRGKRRDRRSGRDHCPGNPAGPGPGPAGLCGARRRSSRPVSGHRAGTRMRSQASLTASSWAARSTRPKDPGSLPRSPMRTSAGIKTVIQPFFCAPIARCPQ